MKKTFPLLALALGTGAVAVTWLAMSQNGGTPINAAEIEHSGNHYKEVAPTGLTQGVKEYWVCCGCHEVFLSQPSSGTWEDKTLTSGQINEVVGDMVLPSLAPYVHDDYKAKGVAVEKGDDGVFAYTNGTAGVVTGDNSNWGESGLFFMENTGSAFNVITSTGYKYLKFDVNFGGTVSSFNLRYGSGVKDYYVTEIGFDQSLPNGREVNLFDVDGKRVISISHDTWYTLYIKLVGGTNMNAFWTNGGSLATPSVTKVKNITVAKEINPSVAPYFKANASGSVTVSTDEGKEGAFKAVTNGGDNTLAFSGITHTQSPDGVEYAGGFFDDNSNEYFVMDYYVSSDNSMLNLSFAGNGFAQSGNAFLSKTANSSVAKIYQNGAEVAYLQDGWNTIVFHTPHTAGGWTDYLLNLGGSVGYLKNLYYTKTAPTF